MELLDSFFFEGRVYKLDLKNRLLSLDDNLKNQDVVFQFPKEKLLISIENISPFFLSVSILNRKGKIDKKISIKIPGIKLRNENILQTIRNTTSSCFQTDNILIYLFYYEKSIAVLYWPNFKNNFANVHLLFKEVKIEYFYSKLNSYIEKIEDNIFKIYFYSIDEKDGDMIRFSLTYDLNYNDIYESFNIYQNNEISKNFDYSNSIIFGNNNTMLAKLEENSKKIIRIRYYEIKINSSRIKLNEIYNHEIKLRNYKKFFYTDKFILLFTCNSIFCNLKDNPIQLKITFQENIIQMPKSLFQKINKYYFNDSLIKNIKVDDALMDLKSFSFKNHLNFQIKGELQGIENENRKKLFILLINARLIKNNLYFNSISNRFFYLQLKSNSFYLSEIDIDLNNLSKLNGNLFGIDNKKLLILNDREEIQKEIDLLKLLPSDNLEISFSCIIKSLILIIVYNQIRMHKFDSIIINENTESIIACENEISEFVLLNDESLFLIECINDDSLRIYKVNQSTNEPLISIKKAMQSNISFFLNKIEFSLNASLFLISIVGLCDGNLLIISVSNERNNYSIEKEIIKVSDNLIFNISKISQKDGKYLFLIQDSENEKYIIEMVQFRSDGVNFPKIKHYNVKIDFFDKYFDMNTFNPILLNLEPKKELLLSYSILQDSFLFLDIEIFEGKKEADSIEILEDVMNLENFEMTEENSNKNDKENYIVMVTSSFTKYKLKIFKNNTLYHEILLKNISKINYCEIVKNPFSSRILIFINYSSLEISNLLIIYDCLARKSEIISNINTLLEGKSEKLLKMTKFVALSSDCYLVQCEENIIFFQLNDDYKLILEKIYTLEGEWKIEGIHCLEENYDLDSYHIPNTLILYEKATILLASPDKSRKSFFKVISKVNFDSSSKINLIFTVSSSSMIVLVNNAEIYEIFIEKGKLISNLLYISSEIIHVCPFHKDNIRIQDHLIAIKESGQILILKRGLEDKFEVLTSNSIN